MKLATTAVTSILPAQDCEGCRAIFMSPSCIWGRFPNRRAGIPAFWLLLSSVVALAPACARDAGIEGTGGSAVGGQSGGGSGGTIVIAPPPTALPPESPCTTGSSGPRLLRRLSAPEFAASVRDLFGDQSAPVATVFNDPPALGFRVDANGLLVRDLTGQQLMDNAETLARWAVSNRLDSLSTCTTMDAACRQQFINSFGKRAFRGPLSSTRLADYDQLFVAETSFSAGAEAVISAMLQSPYFLYRRELGADSANPPATGDVALTPYEIASSLSYLLIGSMPDDQLMAAADAGSLSTPHRSTSRLQGCSRMRGARTPSCDSRRVGSSWIA